MMEQRVSLRVPRTTALDWARRGPTHQPVEQLANLRTIPRMVVILSC